MNRFAEILNSFKIAYKRHEERFTGILIRIEHDEEYAIYTAYGHNVREGCIICSYAFKKDENFDAQMQDYNLKLIGDQIREDLNIKVVFTDNRYDNTLENFLYSKIKLAVYQVELSSKVDGMKEYDLELTTWKNPNLSRLSLVKENKQGFDFIIEKSCDFENRHKMLKDICLSDLMHHERAINFFESIREQKAHG